MSQTSRAGALMRTSLRGIANKARRESGHRFQDLSRLLSEGFLRGGWGIGRYGGEGVFRFSRFQLGKQSESFEFLGFEFRWMLDRKGVPRVRRWTARERLRASLKRVSEWCREMRS